MSEGQDTAFEERFPAFCDEMKTLVKALRAKRRWRLRLFTNYRDTSLVEHVNNYYRTRCWQVGDENFYVSAKSEALVRRTTAFGTTEGGMLTWAYPPQLDLEHLTDLMRTMRENL